MTKQRPLDDYTIDCADFFAVTIQRAFPELTLQEGRSDQGRPVWRIILPPQSTYNVREIDDLAAKTQRQIFMRHSRLIGYVITKSGE
jgi:hypothetical protein